MNLRFLPSFSPLQLALGFSIGLHAVLLTLRFVDPESFNRVFQDTPLEVILVNAKSATPPDRATAIAQASLAGGGEAEQGRATSPLPPSALTDLGETMEETQRKMDAMQQQQTMLLAQVSQQLASMPLPDPKQASNSPEAAAQEEKRRQLLNLLAEIERRINQENSRPKRRYVSPATREEVYAVYYDGLRRRVEDRGTENFPEYAGKKLYGALTMIVTVNYDGQVLATQIAESSGNRTLDRRAEAIVRSAGPFGQFSDAMRAKVDQLVVVSRFRFTRDQTLETKVGATP
ncbi:protein TonB [Rhodoferax sp. OV413]|uniref:energy transducer TonB n=1 Tax=Rhodoferax sp. OV413 TaxID=1855285 RepID=UPI00088EB4E3|nr:TonB family protein [Rhodoferax sp. OV413]SDP93705.1 protein TonB [Rhodoferax sp. OV413]